MSHAPAVTERVFDLYRRHAAEVKEAIGSMLARHAPAIIERTLPGDCLLRTVYESGAVTSLPAANAGTTMNVPTEPDAAQIGANGTAPKYVIRKGVGIWDLVFEGKKTGVLDGKGIQYVAWLLRNPPSEPIYGSELANQALGDAIIEGQLNLGKDDWEGYAVKKKAMSECQGTIDNPEASDVEKKEAEKEKDEVIEWMQKYQRGTEAGEQKQIRAIRQAIRRFLEQLEEAKDNKGGPNQVSRDFGQHVDRYLWQPSSRCSGSRTSRVRAGLAGCFIYEPPDGVKWSG